MSISKERAEHLICVLRAMAEGKIVQVRLRDGYSWLETNSMDTDYRFEYRIKPEPRKTYYRLWENVDGLVCTVTAALESDRRGWTEHTENRSSFKRWAGDWQEHTVQED